MKKILGIFILCTLSFIEAWCFEANVSMNIEYNQSFEYSNQLQQLKNNSIGISFSAFEFFNSKRIGLFIHENFLIPISVSSVIYPKNIKNDYKIPLSILGALGIGFKFKILKKMELKIGIGASLRFMEYHLQYDETVQYAYGPFTHTRYITSDSISGGLLTNLCISYDITENVFFNLGTLFNIDFINYTKLDGLNTPFNYKGMLSNYYGFNFNPFIGIGYNFKL